MSEIEKEYGWDDEISRDDEFTVLPEGDYDFEVISFERSRSNGSDKLPPSNMAILNIRVTNGRESTTVKEYLVLHSKMEWKLSQFFRSIGQKKHGEAVRMNWNAVPGAKGRCKLTIEDFTNDKGEEKEYNRIAKFYDYTAPAPAARSWKPGDF